MTTSQFFRHPLVIFLWGGVSLVIIITLIKNIVDLQNKSQIAVSVEQEVSQLRQEVTEKETQLQQQDATFTQEAIIRNELNMQKPGETVLQIPTEALASPTPESTTSEADSEPIYRQWLRVFFDKQG